MSDRVDRAERLLNLVFALMSTSRAIPRVAIREQVPGYGGAASDAAFERMFERDKDELRSMGIPVETVTDETGEVLGYRIGRDTYAMPPMDLTLEERSAIAVAAQIWGHAQVAPVAGTAVRKLQSVSVDASSWTPTDLRGDVRLTTSDAALLPLMSALRAGVVVTFEYRSPAEDVSRRRTVSPWRLTTREGHWMLHGHDHDRDDLRTFRVSRIVGTVTVTARPRVDPGADDTRSVDPDRAACRARVRAEPGFGAALRRAAVPDGSGWSVDEFEVEVPSLEALASLVCGAAGRVSVVSPPEAVTAVEESWRQVLDAHAKVPE